MEITNTDAEGRLILADALDRASEENPELLIDFATLPGAARVALGPEYPALMTRRSDTADALIAAGRAHDDEPWRLPLPDSYVEWLDSPLADCINAPRTVLPGQAWQACSSTSSSATASTGHTSIHMRGVPHPSRVAPRAAKLMACGRAGTC